MLVDVGRWIGAFVRAGGQHGRNIARESRQVLLEHTRSAVAGVAALIGGVDAPPEIVRLPLPCFLGASLLFYLLTHDRRVSRWEGLLFVAGYLLLVAELAGLA